MVDYSPIFRKKTIYVKNRASLRRWRWPRVCVRPAAAKNRLLSSRVLNTLSNWNEPHIGELFSGCCGSILVAAFAIASSLSICVGTLIFVTPREREMMARSKTFQFIHPSSDSMMITNRPPQLTQFHLSLFDFHSPFFSLIFVGTCWSSLMMLDSMWRVNSTLDSCRLVCFTFKSKTEKCS